MSERRYGWPDVIGMLGLAFVMLPILVVWRAYSLFHVDPLSVGQAAGLAVVVSVFTLQPPPKAPKDDEGAWTKTLRDYATAFCSPLVFLTSGLIVRAIW